MNQPELGKKIAELRKAKGLTQEELVEKCNLSVRTLQRIESGEVTPRSYTLKTIFAALEYPGYLSSENENGQTVATVSAISNWPQHFYNYVLDLFNLKTHTMKKITILSATCLILLLAILAFTTETKAQKAEKAIKTIIDLQTKGNKWMSEGKIDSVLTLYRWDANVLPHLHGKTEIREMLQEAIDGDFKLIEFENLSISVSDSIAVQKYYDVYEFNGNTYKQKGMTEWRLIRGKWLVVNDIAVNY